MSLLTRQLSVIRNQLKTDGRLLHLDASLAREAFVFMANQLHHSKFD